MIEWRFISVEEPAEPWNFWDYAFLGICLGLLAYLGYALVEIIR